jgi:hypothetical protein
MTVDYRLQRIGLLAADEDRARIRESLEGLSLAVCVHDPAVPPVPRGAAEAGPDLMIVSIPGERTARREGRHVPAPSYFYDTWHAVIREMRDQGASVLAAVPAGYPALEGVFASGADEVIEGPVTSRALEGRLRALCARWEAGRDAGAAARLGSGARRAASPSADRYGSAALGSYSGAVHDPRSGRIDAKRVAAFFGVPLRQLTRVLEAAYGTVHKTPDAPGLQPALRPLAEIVGLLNELASTPQEVRVWLNRPLPELEGDTPLDTILAGEAEAVETLLLNAREGIPG